MDSKSVFNEALSNFTREFAYAGAVRHLYESGCTVEQIQAELDYPASYEQIKRVIDEYEEKKSNPEKAFKYVEDVDAYGKKSYRKVRQDN